MTVWTIEGKLISRYMLKNESPLPLLREIHVDSILIKHLYSVAVSYNSQVTLTLSKIILVSPRMVGLWITYGIGCCEDGVN